MVAEGRERIYLFLLWMFPVTFGHPYFVFLQELDPLSLFPYKKSELTQE